MVKWREEVLFVIVYILFACILDSMMVDDIIRFSLCLVTLVTLGSFYLLSHEWQQVDARAFQVI